MLATAQKTLKTSHLQPALARCAAGENVALICLGSNLSTTSKVFGSRDSCAPGTLLHSSIHALFGTSKPGEKVVCRMSMLPFNAYGNLISLASGTDDSSKRVAVVRGAWPVCSLACS